MQRNETMTDAKGRRSPILDEEIGFVGLGVMGQPMALNMVNAGIRLIAWNRTPDRAQVLREAGATIAASVDQVFERARIVIAMLFNEAALDEVLQRGTPEFARLVAGKIIVSMGSNSPEYSRSLSAAIGAAGGCYVEAPVSGSRKPAECGQLVSMIGGEQELAREIPFFFATVNVRSQDDDEFVYVRHLWFSHIDSILDIARQAGEPENRCELVRLDLFSPGHVNGQDTYQLDQLKQIWCHPEGGGELRFILADGRTLFYGLCGHDLSTEKEMELVVAL